MKNPRVWLWLLLAAIVAGVLIAIRYQNAGNAAAAPKTAVQSGLAAGQAAPEFTAATDKGYFDLAKTNRPVFLEVFATWCPHCQRETAIVDRLYARYGKRVDFVGVSGSPTGMDHQTPSNEQDVLAFAQTFDARYPLAYDGSLAVAKQYLQGGFPTLAVIDRRKRVTYITAGETPYATLASAIDDALAP